jgi:hypothetical protein
MGGLMEGKTDAGEEQQPCGKARDERAHRGN